MQISKGSLFIDVDGTIIDTTTNLPIQGQVEEVNKQYDAGWFIVITTYRGYNWKVGTMYHATETLRLFKDIGLKYHTIVWDSPNPRVILNDEGCQAIKVKTNVGWNLS